MSRAFFLGVAVSLIVASAQLGFAQVGAPIEREVARTGLVAVQSATSTATVSAIDYEQRIATIRLPDGTTTTFKAGPEVESFNQLKVGDQVLVRN